MTRSRFIFLLAFLGLALTACGNPNPPATTPPALTATQAPSSRETPTPQMTVIPATAVWGDPPNDSASSYTLKAWDAEIAWKFINTQPPSFPQNSDGRAYEEIADWAKVKLMVLHEIAARFPDSIYASEAVETSLKFNSEIYAPSAPIEPFRAAFEAALNDTPNVEISPTGLTTLLTEKLPANSSQVVEALPANNLLGNGKPGWVLDVRAGGFYYGMALALAGEPGAYRVVSPRAEWSIFTWNDQKILSYDLNANGVPEIAIHDSYWGTGSSHFCREEFALFEWNDGRFTDLTPDLWTYAQRDFANCLDFEFVPGPNGTQAITTGTVIEPLCSITNDPDDADRRLSAPAMKRRYEWNGTFFSLAQDELVPLATSNLNPCTLDWVNQAGPANDQAFQLLPTLLAETDPTLTSSFEEEFGPAYLDYFRFQLGTWYAMRGQQTQAWALLTQVRDAPANPNFDTASQLAEAFLQSYRDTGSYAGCAAADKVLDFNFPQNSIPIPPIPPLNSSGIREDWGFSNWLWGWRVGPIFSRSIVHQDALDSCSLATAFLFAIQRQSFTNTEALTHWLTQQHIPYTGLEEGDVDGDGRRDWLLLVGTGKEQSLQCWVLLNKGNFTLPLWVSETGQTLGNIPATWNTFTNPPGNRLTIYQWPSGMIIFRVVSQPEWTGIEVIHQSSYKEFLGFTLQPIETKSLKTDGPSEIKVLTAGKNFWKPDWYILGWDSASNTVRVTNSPQLIQDQQVQQAESLIFDKANPIAATKVISQLLSLENNLLDFDMTEYNRLPTVRPYLLYLQGLAYEMSGEEPKAIEAYWTLWHDFPIHPLSYVVQQKLEKRQ
jgi:hypothetical protein